MCRLSSRVVQPGPLIIRPPPPPDRDRLASASVSVTGVHRTNSQARTTTASFLSPLTMGTSI